MPSHGTRRNTILTRRAGYKARLAHWAKRFSIILVAIALTGYGVFYLWASGWVAQTAGRIERSFYDASGDAGFRVANLVIEGRVNMPAAQVREMTGVSPGDPIFATNLDDIRQKLAAVPWVESALVERRLPDTLYINLTERVPLALWQRQGKLALVDAKGTILANSSLDKFRNLPIIVGDNAPRYASGLVALIHAEPALKSRLESAKWIGGRRWDLYLKNGIVVRLPEEDQGQAIARLSREQRGGGIMDRQIEAIDLRDPMKIVVQTKPGAIESMDASYVPDKNI